MLLTLLLALPAMQANACTPEASGHAMHAHASLMPAAMAHHDHHGGAPEAPAPAPAKAHHDCIGCVAPIDITAYRPAERMMIAARDHSLPKPAFLIGQNRSPEPRPPRLSA